MTSKARFLLSLAVFCTAAANLSAATFTWDGKGSGGNVNDWAATQNWTGISAPGATDLAQFNTVTAGRSTTPTIFAARSIGEIQFGAAGNPFTIGGAFALTLNAIGGVGIQNDNTTAAQAINTSSLVLGAAQTWNNAGTLNVGATAFTMNNALTVAGAGATTISSPITGSAGITKTGGGSLTLSGANTYSGSSTISAGTLGFSGSGRLGSGGAALNGGTLTVSSDAQLGTAGNLSFGGGTLQTGAGITSSRSVTLNSGGGTVDVSGSSGLSGDITGVGGLTKAGSGTLSLLGNNSYSGGLTVNGGTLDATGSATALGAPSSITLNNGALSITATPTVGPMTFNSGAVLNQGTSAATFGALTVNGNSSINLGGSGSLTFASASQSSGILSINNWTGPAYDPEALNTGSTAVKIFVTSPPDANFLSNVQFAGVNGTYPQGAAIFGGNELVPVPEPQVYAIIFAAGLLGFAIVRRRMLAVA